MKNIPSVSFIYTMFLELKKNDFTLEVPALTLGQFTAHCD